jgi:hypothetical protein
MKKILIALGSAILLLSCSDPKVQEDLKALKADLDQLKKDHAQLRDDHNKLVKDAIKAEVKAEDKLEGSKMD